eukprot:1156026-Pelagomonas_calceolata.AAC.2
MHNVQLIIDPCPMRAPGPQASQCHRSMSPAQSYYQNTHTGFFKNLCVAHPHLDPRQVATECRQVGSEGLLIPNVCEHAAVGGQGGGLLGRDGQAGPGHEGRQPQGFHRGCLAACVGA